MRFHYVIVFSLALIGAAAAQGTSAPAPRPNQAPAAGDAAPGDEGAPGEDAAPSDVDGRLPKPSTATEFAPTAEKVRFDFLSILNPDCSSMGPLSYRVLTKPQHGELSFVQDQGFPNFKESNIRSRCNTGKVPGLSIFYKSADQFVGEDKATVLFLYPDASADVMEYTVVVR